MAIFAEELPHMITKLKKVALPQKDLATGKTGVNNLVFLFTDSVENSISLVNNTDNCYNYGRYYYYYYNLRYYGTINNRRYNINKLSDKKVVYNKIREKTKLAPYPTQTLNRKQNKNTYFDMSKYFEIYKYMTAKLPVAKRVTLFWKYFNSIWFSDQTSGFEQKWVLLNADMYPKFNGELKEVLSNPIFMLYYTLYRYFNLVETLDIDFFIYSDKAVLRVNPSKCDKKSYNIFKREIKKVYNRVIEFIPDDVLDKETVKEEIKESLVKKYNFVGDEDDKSEVTDLPKKQEKKESPKSSTQSSKEKVRKDLEEKINNKVEQISSQVDNIVPPEERASKDVTSFIAAKTEMEIEDDKKLANDMYKLMQQTRVPTKPISSARDKKLRERQESLTVDNITFSNINEMNSSRREIPTKDVSASLHSVNKNVGVKKFSNINKDYIENVMPQDIAKVFTSLNSKSSKLFVRSMTKEDTSNELNYKETYHVILEDERGTRHSITVDIPKFLENKFLYLSGNKKTINKQAFFYPVVKTAPDTVQIVTNYNKMFIYRRGAKSIGSVERMTKLISNNEEAMKYFMTGSSVNVNKLYLTTLEYDEFSKVILKFETENCTIFFNQKEATEYASEHDIDIPKEMIYIGEKDKKPIFIDSNTQLTPDGETICDLIITELPEDLRVEFTKTRSTKKLMYNTVTVMSQTIPFIVLLMYWEGITSVIKKIGLTYRFTKTYPSEVAVDEAVIKFKDAYFIYKTDFATSLLMNGIKVLDTENHDMEEYNGNDAYIDYFKKVYGKIAIMNALTNYYDFMIDPITKEVLEDINLPTDLIELCIYANNLLADESYTNENSLKISRIRSTEIIPAILYNEISRAYLVYKNSSGKKKISIQKDAVIKQLLALQTVEDYSTLNPVVELDKDRTLMFKGYKGINLDEAYTPAKRSYDDSMVGIVAINTSPDANCGITRYLTLEPTITSARGYLDLKTDKREELRDVNLFSPAELLFPLGATRDDSIRTSYAARQSKHVIPVKNSIPALMSNGVDESIRFDLSSDFVVNAEDNGTVIDYDEKSHILVVEYKNGTRRGIDLSPKVVKNGGGGFFLNNELISNLKVGDKIKKGQPLAWHKDFFKDDKINGLRMNVGSLEKVAIMSSYDTYNDATVITKKLARDCESAMTFCKQVVVGKNSNVYAMKHVGDHVEIGDPLIIFDTSFEDSDLNKLLAHLSDENKETLEEGSRNTVKSKNAGKIIDIRIYSTVELGELSESLQKILKSHYSSINHKKQFLSKYDTDSDSSIIKCGILLNETTGKIEPNIYGVLKGQKVEDSVLIEFYIEHGDIMGVGDKLTYFTALKSIVSEVIPEGYEPYSEYRQNEEVSSLIGPSAILKRQVPSILLTVFGNKVIVELKRHLQEIYEKE